MDRSMKIEKYFILALVIIILDQTSKLLVHKYMYLHQEINVIGDWFRLHYLLNPVAILSASRLFL